MAIGESSNLSQLAQTYSYSFNDNKYVVYADILAVLAQCSIDNSKRVYAVNINDEIKRIKELLDVENNKYPEFWFGLQRKNKFSKSIMAHSMAAEAQRLKNESKTNHDLICPMNFLFNYQFPRNDFRTRTIPLSSFFLKEPVKFDKRRSKKAEALIHRYVIDKERGEQMSVELPLLEEEYENLIHDLSGSYIKENDYAVVASIIDRAFLLTPAMRNYEGSQVRDHHQDLLNILYRTSPKALLKCFSNKI